LDRIVRPPFPVSRLHFSIQSSSHHKSSGNYFGGQGSLRPDGTGVTLTLDALSENVMKKAGVQIGSHEVNLADSPWKSDDALWFKNHPNRSHRLRPMFDGEAATIPSKFTEGKIPEGYGREILVRQVDVGQRIRAVLCRNMEVPMPDSEEIIHAIFDSVTRGEDGIVSIDEIMALARKYGTSNAEQLN
ncbi:MAG: hypothetical protein Q8R69_01100, partial [Telluria sp.]|nr:hypothetical protein [Telluria sp.]